MAKQRKNYIENEDMKRELILSHEKNEPTDALVKMFQMQVERQMRPFKYQNLDDKHDIYIGALCTALRKWRECDVTRERPFAWFTRVIYNAIYHYWNQLNSKQKVTVSINSIFEESI